MYSLIGMADVNVNQAESSADDCGFRSGEATSVPASVRQPAPQAGTTEVRNRHARAGNSTTTESINLQQQLEAQEQDEQESRTF